MPAFKNSFLPTLKLEKGMCFTVLKNVEEKDVQGFSEKLEFTLWSPECYSSKPSTPSDILAYINGEMRIYHTTVAEQIEELFATQQKDILKICGYRPRTSSPFELSGVSFSEELPGDMIDVPAGVLELSGYALDDLCGIINESAHVLSLLDSADNFEDLYDNLLVVLPRVVQVLTDKQDESLLENFKKITLANKSFRNKRHFFQDFYRTFLKTETGNEYIFVELMAQRAQATNLFNHSELSFDFLKASKNSLRPLLSSIDIVIYKNFIAPLIDSEDEADSTKL